MLVAPENFRLKKFPAFIVLDGVNGAGKSTLQRNLLDYFAHRNLPAIGTREPGATPIGRKIREMVMGVHETKLAERTELFLFAADRAEHVAKVITPNLSGGTSVISDRYYYSTVAFQGYGRGMDLGMINFVNTMAVANAVPDLVIILDLDPMLGIRRNSAAPARAAKNEEDGFEHEKSDFQNRMRQGFLECAQKVPETCIVLDANKPPLEIFHQVKDILDRT
jgi:dTMP kinase